MTDRELELRLKKAVESCTPDVLEQVLEQCDNYENRVLPFEKKKLSFKRYMTVAAACFVLVVAGLWGLNIGRVASIISLEINPSIEIKIDKRERVVEAKAVNEDAEEILSGMKLEGTDIHTATNAIIGSLLKHGYIDELANSILLSVEDKNSERGTELQKTLSKEIGAILEGASINAAILSQYVVGEDVDEKSTEYHISHGKAALIEHLLEANSSYTFGELAALSVNELNILIENQSTEVKDVETKGKASAGAYIGAERANEIAFEHSDIDASTIYEMEIEMDYEYHTMVYEVEFIIDGIEYEYDIDAVTGEVLNFGKEIAD